jgi:hypothetical protein
MGCDYYIYKILEVRNSEGEIIWTIELSRNKVYYPEAVWSSNSFDSDDSDYEEKVSERKSQYLDVEYEPKMLFENGLWKNEETEIKYSHIIKNRLTSEQMNKIATIVKTEYREERE